jgi:predicted nucleic acid-binding protein
VPSRRIVNTSPLILLTKTGRLDLLRLGGVEVLVPDTVVGEIEAGAGYDSTIDAIRQADWLSVVTCPTLPDPVRNCRLDPGESAVLALAYSDPGSEVVLDDLAARRAAARLGIPCLGTLGLVLTAKGLGMIPEARPLVAQLRRAGLYLDDEFTEEVLRRIGE